MKMRGKAEEFFLPVGRIACKGGTVVKSRLRSIALAVALIAGQAITASGQGAEIGTPAPEIGGGAWINSSPLTLDRLRGRVVLVEFWTYG